MRKRIVSEGTLWSLALTAGVLWCVQPESHMPHPGLKPTGGTENPGVVRPHRVIVHEAPDAQMITHLHTIANANLHTVRMPTLVD